jgi:16S rRNA (guanine966-N2)-methyltransferase
VLDLFAGSGALALEALSRGAASATLVDSAPAAIKAIRANVAALGIPAEQADVRRQDVRAFLRSARGARHEYDLVLVDPPYRLAAELGRELSPSIAAVLAPGGRVVSESDRRSPLDLEPDLPLTDERRYGDTLIRTHDRTE